MSSDARKPQPPPIYKVKRTFHQRVLPSSTCTSFSSPDGRELFDSASRNHGLKSFFCLIEQFSTQSDPAFCAITTLVMVLNTLLVDPRIIWKGVWRWYEDSMLNCCIDMESVKKSGVTWNQFLCLAHCQGLQSERFLASESSVEDFRAAVKGVCIEQNEPTSSSSEEETPCESKSKCVKDDKSSKKILVATYNRGTLNQTGDGHFSPIAAYDPISDKVLILDVARFKYGPHWVSLPLLFDAMIPCDPATNQSRGFILLSFQETADCCQQVLPQSILFRSEMSNYATRRRFRDFLSSKEKSDSGRKITFEDVRMFFSDNGTDYDSVLEMISPQLIPIELTDKKNVDNLLYLIQSLTLIYIEKYESESCLLGEIPIRKAARRMIQIRFVDIIYVIFLASLSFAESKEVVHQSMDENKIDDVADVVVEQLVSEAELVRLAIEYSYANLDRPDQVNRENEK